MKGLTIALAGNPNCGKTTLFNLLTGSNQYVGNWAGVTVEQKSGRVGGHTLVDLPGLYSLTPYTLEERVARDFLLDGGADVILNIVDGSNLERNLYLTLQLLELGRPVVVAVNMVDELERRGGKLDARGLSEELGVPVIPIVARRGEGTQALLPALLEAELPRGRVHYQEPVEGALRGLTALFAPNPAAAFLAGKLLEGEGDARVLLCLPSGRTEEARRILARCARESEVGDRDAILADARYRFLTDLAARRVVKGREVGVSFSQRVDRLVVGRFTALPIFLLVMLTVFSATFSGPGMALKRGMEWLVGEFFGNALRMLLIRWEAPGWAFSLLTEAVLGGVGAVLSFLPQILLLFLFLSLLEDSGYMARAAFVMDRLLSKIGLTGKSFIPMLMGFGCTTPAVMAARGLGSERERRLTILLIPFLSCSAKLPIYALFAGAFFPKFQGLVVFFLYLLGVLMALVVGLLLKNTIFKGESSPFLLELPPYRLPTPKNLIQHLWEKCSGFLLKAGGIIFLMSLLVWGLGRYTPALTLAKESAESIFGVLGGVLAPVLAPLGFGSWQAAVSLLAGLAAKEAVVSTMMVLYSAGSQGALSGVLIGVFTPASALSFLVFCLFYTPCVAAFSTMRREMGGMHWALFSAGMQCGIAYIVAFLIYPLALFVGI